MAIGYVTVAEADAYITARYVSTDAARIRWNDLEEADKEAYLLRSVEALDQLPFHGRRAVLTQLNAFPRYPSTVVPESVKAAQVENALKLTDTSGDADVELYSKMRMFGVKSYSIGNLSETLGAPTTSVMLSPDFVSEKAYRLVSRYIYGGYRIV